MKYVVVDSDNFWSVFGEFDSPESALKEALEGPYQDNPLPEIIRVFEISTETVFKLKGEHDYIKES